MPKILDLVGQQFGRLIVAGRIGSKRSSEGRSSIWWNCVCACGASCEVDTNSLRSGNTKSCGCLMRETSARIAKEHPLAPRPVNLSGRKFGLLTAIEPLSQRSNRRILWKCLCACGREHTTTAGSLTTGKVRSCGCFKGISNVTHGATIGGDWRPGYSVWAGMLGRCLNPRNEAYDRYGGRGITVCERWHSFEKFYADMGPKPPGLTIDRINNNGNYEPGNCRWATYRQQARNTRANKLVTCDGITDCVAGWADRTGLPARLIAKRLAAGWTPVRALTR